ncbi:MAG: bifunctional diaminohydroxyphosphoribosylaminopyrimidine deaminase/5-amino-6-(5-phosphoribosylamino)uracil reductase RibD [Planctomycetota bacterium]|jgi:diaminohydroxyphosphoribosylaminopyrimidine deaminase/5-amino-6-(5-phosphoribosylamino)uracil reductase
MNAQDEKFMQTALKLARRGVSSVEPNPVVGAVITKANQIIGKGWHRKFGGPHAEINAIEDCQTIGVTPRGGTMYVTLEPCSHHGKTGPCTDAIISAGLTKVIVAMIDPSAHAGGKGIEQLRRAEVEVEVGLCETEARLSNGPFVKFATTGTCWVTLKWAQSIDGRVAWAEQSTEQRWISNEQSRKDVHKLRRGAQAILVGVNTVIADDPLLTARPSKGKKAFRVVMDNSLRIPSDCQLVRTAGKSPVMIVTKQETAAAKPEVVEELTGKGVEVIARSDTDSRSSLHFVLDELSSRGITHLLVEGGPTILTSFLRENLADEIVVYIAPKILGGRGGAGIAGPVAELPAALGLQNVEIAQFGDDVRLSGWTARAVREISESTYE